MTSIQIDKHNNIVVEGKTITITTGINACAQDVRTRIGLCRGEDPYDTERGIDFFGTVLGKYGGIEYIRNLIRERIMDSDEIVGVTNLEITKQDDTTQVDAEILSTYGAIKL
jgi:hypothetical protein